ncbi:selenide, water dikinase SelD [Corynebacterium uberis]|uniref:selenide, water dikinase SelD n=1 Tax=Corynebacterium TaxID=1716 RepID=UPI001D09B09E|nr:MULTISPECIES: selenide, water dikinase SelD [Corynebacterium]MCZ9308913.1 selenide, water dikinase SelD [Corynebacterium sp. c6VSa_13]UDL74613.1 selenide, water dikinase SelD [Corynebacterium uberis]UDL76553.1 selenide, water dikinase SelD [Corynebacterium uberis]UDL78766.1 selenide, water dikinase SelD [Corynebacterium uberis]UDL81044.1 selenide, water dikinase SelD [Corynebacterium uberis]
MSTQHDPLRLTQFAAGGGCACKIPPGQLEDTVKDLVGMQDPNVIVGLDDGDDAAAVRINGISGSGDLAVISTTDFFTPVVDDPYDWGRIAATNALSDIYAMGGTPLTTINIVGWPQDVLPLTVLREVLRGGMDVASDAGIAVTGGHSIKAPEPFYGMAATGLVDPAKLMRNDAAAPGLPITLTKPLGVGILNNRHKKTGEVFPEAIATMTTLNRDAARAAVAAGAKAATDVTGFGLLGHLYKMLRASQVSATIDHAKVPLIDAAVTAVHEGFIPGGSRSNFDWVSPHVESDLDFESLILLADAQTSGGLLVIGEVPGYPVIGQTTVADGEPTITVV